MSLIKVHGRYDANFHLAGIGSAIRAWACEVFESTQFGHYTRSRPRIPLGDAKSRKLAVYMRFPWSA
jgi:hypothetical protein